MSDRSHGSGPSIGTRHANKAPRYDPESGRSYRTAVTLQPEDAVRLITLADRAGLSVSGLLNALVKNVEINPETGLPPFLEPSQDAHHLFEAAS